MTIVTAIAILAASLLPFLLSGEPITRHRRPDYSRGSGQKMKTNKSVVWQQRPARVFAYVGNQLYWTVYIAITIFATNTYAILGASDDGQSCFLAFFAAIFIGRLTDRGQGAIC